jgi:hypothetical protein
MIDDNTQKPANFKIRGLEYFMVEVIKTEYRQVLPFLGLQIL